MMGVAVGRHEKFMACISSHEKHLAIIRKAAKVGNPSNTGITLYSRLEVWIINLASQHLLNHLNAGGGAGEKLWYSRKTFWE